MTSTLDSAASALHASAVPLVVPVSPIPGESISELVLRAAALNSYYDVSHVFSAAGILFRGPPSIPGRARGREESLAITLGIPEGKDLVEELCLNPDKNNPGWSNFFGVPLRSVYRDLKHRRISPRSLRKSPHAKAIWSVRVLSFDPGTKEQLLEKCPECSAKPTYLRSHGLQYCEFCTGFDECGIPVNRVDFRDFPQPFVEIEDMEALDFVIDLIDPERDLKRDRLHLLHSDLRMFDRSQLFELVVAIACVMTTDPAWKATTLDRPSGHESYSRFQPEILAKAGRVLLNWPGAFHGLAEEVRAAAPLRTGFFGVKKELGPLVAASMDAHLAPPVRDLLKDMIKLDMSNTSEEAEAVRRVEHRAGSEFIPIQKAALKYGLNRRTISRLAKQGLVQSKKVSGAKKAPVLVKVDEVANYAESRAEAVGSQSVAVQLGIPRACLPSLAKKGYLTPIKGMRHASGSEFYERASVEKLVQRCRKMANGTAVPEEFVRITKAVNRLGFADGNPWISIIERILLGTLQVWTIEGRLTALMTSLAVRHISELADLSAKKEMRAVGDRIIFNQAEAAEFLGASVVSVSHLMQKGFIPAKPTTQALKAFAKEFILTSEIRDLLSSRGRELRWRDIPSALMDNGVKPAVLLLGNRGFVWRRAEVVPLIEKLSAN